jgi:hypothetical protein
MFRLPARRRPSATMVVALVALVAASAGVGNAATSLITGKQIKNGSVTGADIKDGSIAGKDIKNKSVPIAKLSGQLPTGPAGPAGPAGAAGPTGPAGPVQKAISLDVVSAADTATFVHAFGALGGLSFADGVSNGGSFHFVLPANYTAGTPLTGTFTWHTPGVSCAVLWRANYTSVSRAGQVDPDGGSATSGMTDPGPLANGPTANVVQAGTFTLTSPSNAFTLQPGDSYTFGIFRSGAAGGDTCTAAALIDSMVITYS